MENKIASVIQNNPELLSKVEEAIKFLKEKQEYSGIPVQAEWDQTQDQDGRPLLQLKLTDWSGEVRGNFSLAEFNDADRLEQRLLRLWGDLLASRNKQQLKQLRILIDQL